MCMCVVEVRTPPLESLCVRVCVVESEREREKQPQLRGLCCKFELLAAQLRRLYLPFSLLPSLSLIPCARVCIVNEGDGDQKGVCVCARTHVHMAV